MNDNEKLKEALRDIIRINEKDCTCDSPYPGSCGCSRRMASVAYEALGDKPWKCRCCPHDAWVEHGLCEQCIENSS